MINVNRKEKKKIFFGCDKSIMFPKSVFFIFKFCERVVKHTVLLIRVNSPYLKISVSSLLGQFYKKKS